LGESTAQSQNPNWGELYTAELVSFDKIGESPVDQNEAICSCATAEVLAALGNIREPIKTTPRECKHRGPGVLINRPSCLVMHGLQELNIADR
jgi:hypothetical protein